MFPHPGSQSLLLKNVTVAGIEPLYLDDSAAQALIIGAIAFWVIAELCVVIRNRGGENSFGRSEAAIGACWALGLTFGSLAVYLEVGVFGGGWAVFGIGMAIFALGLGLRYWAIFTLGRFFMHTVAIQPDHQIIRSGPYRLLRHPSYTGATLAFIGLGIALQNWLSLLVLFVLPLIGTLIRVKVEDEALAGALGDDYREYAGGTRRLIPGVW